MNRIFSIRSSSRRQGRSLALAAIVGACALAGAATVGAQATSGTVFGKAPAGYTVTVHNTTSGFEHQVSVDAKGRYTVKALPVGVYDVTLEQNGRPVVRHPNVPVVVGRGIKVDFDCAPGQCGEVADKQ